jgi:hypothetical protein
MLESPDVTIVTLFYLSTGLVDGYVFSLDFRMVHMAILASLCLLASAGLFWLKRWGLYLAGALIMPQGCVPVTSLLVSLRSYGAQALNSALALWTVLHIFVSLLVIYMLLTARERFR